MSLGGRLRIRRVPVQILLGIQPGLETPNLIMMLPVTLGSNKYLYSVTNIGLVRLPPRQWPNLSLYY